MSKQKDRDLNRQYRSKSSLGSNKKMIDPLFKLDHPSLIVDKMTLIIILA